MSNYVYFNNEYFFTKDQFTNKLNEKLADSDSLFFLQFVFQC